MRASVAVAVAALVWVAGCTGAPDPDAGASDAGRCEEAICVSGQLGGERQRFVAGWWGPTLGIPGPSMTGGFTAASSVRDACATVQAHEPPPDGWSFGFIVWDRDGDGDADGLPDPGVYPILPGWEGEHPEAVGAELLAGRAEGGLTVPSSAVTGRGGTLTILEIEREGRVVGTIDAALDEDTGTVSGSFEIEHCHPLGG